VSKILLLDIEWKPTKAYVWQPWQENITPEKIIEHGGLLCVGLKWYGSRETLLFSEWEHGHEEMVRRTHEMLSAADIVVTYNGDKYDLRKLEGEFLLAKLPPPPPITSIDVLKQVRKFGFFMNRLGFVAPFLNLGGKLEHEGMALWTKVDNGDEKAQKKMGKYCKQDVVLLEKLYNRIKPYIRNHPHSGKTKGIACGACGSEKLQSRGVRRTKYFEIQRIHCQSCGSWQDGKRKKV
jgi:hypothetical protein